MLKKKLLFGYGIIVCGTLSLAGFSAAFSGDGIQNLAVALVFLLLTVFLIRKWPRQKPKTSVKVRTIAERPIQTRPVELEIPIAEIYTRRVDTEEENVTAKDAPFSYLDARALIFWDQKTTDYKIPSYYSDSAFGRNALPALKRLLDGGYLDFASLEKSIALKKVPDLKAILSERELKVSGNKAELIHRLMDNLSESDLMEIFPTRVYEITPKGMEALNYYSIIFENEKHNLSFSFYRLLEEKEANASLDDDEILLRMLLSDIAKTEERGNEDSYRIAVEKAARFMEETGCHKMAIGWYSVAFFMFWYRNTAMLGVDGTLESYNYQAKAIDRCGKLCGYSLQDLLKEFRDSVQKVNPFSLATKRNIDLAIKKFKESLLS